MNENYIMLPNNIVWCKDEGEESLCKCNNKLLLVISYLNFNVNLAGNCCFTLDDMITSCGLITRTGTGNTIEQFKIILKQLQVIKWLDINIDIDSIKPKQFIKCKFKPTFKKDEDDNDTEFFKLFYDKYIKIMNNNSGLDKAITLKVFSYITARMKRNTKEQKENREVHIFQDTEIECFYDKYEVICYDLNINDVTFNNNINLLQDLELIFFDNIGLVKYKDFSSYPASNVYAETKDYLKFGLNNSIEYYKKKGCEIIGKKTSKKKKKEIGLKGKEIEIDNKEKRKSIIAEIKIIFDELEPICGVEGIKKALANKNTKTKNIEELKQIKIVLEKLKEDYADLPY